MAPGALKKLSKETIDAFTALIPNAKIKGSVASWMVSGLLGHVRIKRAEAVANQIHPWHGEPIAVHVPSGGKAGGEWFVLPVSWQLSYARRNAKEARQHASHAFDCMMVVRDQLPTKLRVTDANDLKVACERAILETRTKEMRFIVKATERVRDAVADALIDVFEEELADHLP